MNSKLIQLSRMYSDLYEQEMLIERRMLTMDDSKRNKVRIDLEGIKADMKELHIKIMSMWFRH